MSEERASFGSKLGIIMATAGSAVGLGNIWRFPYMTGENGGAAFILIYIACVIVLGIPCMISEFIIGRHGASNTARAYTRLSNGTAWKLVGYLEVLTGFLITGYYAVISGWCLNYVYASVMGELNGDPAFVKNYFVEFSQNPIRPVFWTIVVFAITHFYNYPWRKKWYREGFKTDDAYFVCTPISYCSSSLDASWSIKGD